MAHAASRRGSLSGDESDYRLFHVGLDEFRCGLFRIAANLADHDHGFSLRIPVEQI